MRTAASTTVSVTTPVMRMAIGTTTDPSKRLITVVGIQTTSPTTPSQLQKSFVRS